MVHVNAVVANQVSAHDPPVVDIKPGQQAHAASPRPAGVLPAGRAAFVRVLSNTRG